MLPRKDLRKNQHTREISADLGVIGEADGSAHFYQGKTSVLASVIGPTQPKYSRHELFDKATVDIDVKLSAQNKENNETIVQERRYNKFLRSALENCLDLINFPRLLILFNVLIINDDGASLSTAFNACILAVLDAGIPMKYVPNAISVTLVENLSGSLEVQLDPTKAEEDTNTAAFTFIINPKTNVTNPSAAIISSECVGQFNTDDLELAVNCSVQTSHALFDTMKKILESKLL